MAGQRHGVLHNRHNIHERLSLCLCVCEVRSKNVCPGLGLAGSCSVPIFAYMSAASRRWNWESGVEWRWEGGTMVRCDPIGSYNERLRRGGR